MILFLLANALPLSGTPRFYVDYSRVPDEGKAMAHDVAIFAPAAEVNMERLRKAGVTLYAYISAGEVAPDSTYRDELIQTGIAFLGRNEVWRSDLIDLTDPRWQEFVIERLAREAAERGFDGFFLDTLDAVELLEAAHPDRGPAFREAMISLVHGLREAYPDMKLMANRGFSILEEIAPVTDALLVESLLNTYDFEAGRYESVSGEDRQWLLGWIERASSQGLEVFILDYADPMDPEAALRAAGEIEAMGFSAFVSTPALDGETLGPLREEPRWFHVCYGSVNATPDEPVLWPADTFTATAVQMPMEWLGYNLTYRNIVRDGVLEELPDRYRGIILDPGLVLPLHKESEFADWLISEVERGRKLLIFGSIPFQLPRERSRIMAALGFEGSGIRPSRVEKASITAIDEAIMNFEANVRPMPHGFADLRRPSDGHAFLELSAFNEEKSIEFHPVGTAPWGGWALDPYSIAMRPDGYLLWRVEPFLFLENAIGPAPFPIPDPNTRNGLRVFYSHIDGDGFPNESAVTPGMRSAEIILERILKTYPLPVTVSVIEAEIRKIYEGGNPDNAGLMEAIAREMFNLPHVEAASHTFSHPFVWIPGDRTEGTYENYNIVLTVQYSEIDYEREVAGSVRYIEENLLPPGKKVELFLWSGNTRPGPEAIAWTRRLGIENMNGGMTVITRRLPSLTGVAPRSIPWEDELQIFAASQNENVYTNNWGGPFFGGYIQLLDTLERTERPRRLKPVNIYYHFYSGDRHDSLEAIVRLYDWAMNQELHPITASEYARAIRGSRNVRFFRDLQGDWIAVGSEHVPTLRLPSGGALPETGLDTGVIGYREQDDVTYLHTDGRARVRIRQGAGTQRGLIVESSEASLHFNGFEEQLLSFESSAFGSARLLVTGGQPDETAAVTINGETERLSFDASGRLPVSLPPEATVEIRITGKEIPNQ